MISHGGMVVKEISVVNLLNEEKEECTSVNSLLIVKDKRTYVSCLS